MSNKRETKEKSDEPDAFRLDLEEETIDPDEDDPPMEHLDRKAKPKPKPKRGKKR